MEVFFWGLVNVTYPVYATVQVYLKKVTYCRDQGCGEEYNVEKVKSEEISSSL